jgi:hypothetical protein
MFYHIIFIGACGERVIVDGSYFEEKDDPLVRVLGPEHGGRSRTLPEIIGNIHTYM